MNLVHEFAWCAPGSAVSAVKTMISRMVEHRSLCSKYQARSLVKVIMSFHCQVRIQVEVVQKRLAPWDCFSAPRWSPRATEQEFSQRTDGNILRCYSAQVNNMQVDESLPGRHGMPSLARDVNAFVSKVSTKAVRRSPWHIDLQRLFDIAGAIRFLTDVRRRCDCCKDAQRSLTDAISVMLDGNHHLHELTFNNLMRNGKQYGHNKSHLNLVARVDTFFLCLRIPQDHFIWDIFESTPFLMSLHDTIAWKDLMSIILQVGMLSVYQLKMLQLKEELIHQSGRYPISKRWKDNWRAWIRSSIGRMYVVTF